ncbi:MAG TPA: hypothetical protein DCX64_04825, partial [Gammaproteobacteria bacterium]|nr:hypothetical protein [Gammaproteobacteria bacterium]
MRRVSPSINSAVINTARPIDFVFENKKYSGFDGDSLASALSANGLKV